MKDKKTPEEPVEPKILVPVDFSPFSEQALLFAAHLAGCMKAQIVVLHVVHDPASQPGYYATPIKGSKKRLRRMEDVAQDMLSEFLKKIREAQVNSDALANAQLMLVSGLPVPRILEVAKQIKAGMIVMGGKGRTGLAHILLGSKAEQVVNLSPVPVTIVKTASGKD